MAKRTMHGWFGFDLTQKERFKAIARNGFEAVMLFWLGLSEGTPEGVLPAKELGLDVVNIHLPYHHINALWLESLDGDEQLDLLISLIKQGTSDGVDTFVIHPTTGATPPSISRIGTDRFKRLTEEAAKLGAVLALENVRERSHWDHLLKSITDSHLQICYDSGHSHCTCRDPDMLLPYRGRIRIVHLHDNDGHGDQHLLPFEGTIDWEQEMHLLKSLEYQGPLALEVMGNPGSDVDDYLKRARHAVDRLTMFFES